MANASTLENMSPELLRVVERAQREPEGRFHSLAHLIDASALERAYRRSRKDAAVGVDGVTKEQYGQELEANLQDLHARMKAKRYRHQPIRRVHIPKEGGKTRPIGISAFEDKLVQDAVREVLEAIYEQDFLDCSYGFRPKRSPHDAVRTLDRIVHRGEVSWILEADLVSFFDSLDRKKLKEMLGVRVADGSLLRLIGKCLHVGVLDGVELSTSESGTAQGSVLSPLLGNVYLHYVLDLWFEQEVKPRLRGRATLVRYADDFIIGFEEEVDARRVMEVLGKRLGRFGLALHPDKTRLLPFRRVIQSVYAWCRRHRHSSVKDQHTALTRRIQGHFNYFGVSGNFRSLLLVIEQAKRSWYKWLCRRSHRKRLTWERFADLLRDFPLPVPRITVRIWGS